jgi:hypothetical protein
LNSVIAKYAIIAALVLTLSGCSKDHKPTSPNGNNNNSLGFIGTVNGTNGSLSGSLSFSITNTSVAGTFKVVTPAIATHALAGVYNSTSKVLNATGDGFTFNGLYDGNHRLEGTMTGPTTGLFLAVRNDDNLAMAFCGTFSGDDNGIWNFAIEGTTVTGSFTTTSGSTGALDGAISGNTITIVNPSGGNPLATGTKSGNNASGNWDDGQGHVGTWIGYKNN